jgi:hypothetical protein
MAALSELLCYLNPGHNDRISKTRTAIFAADVIGLGRQTDVDEDRGARLGASQSQPPPWLSAVGLGPLQKGFAKAFPRERSEPRELWCREMHETRRPELKFAL